MVKSWENKQWYWINDPWWNAFLTAIHFHVVYANEWCMNPRRFLCPFVQMQKQDRYHISSFSSLNNLLCYFREEDIIFGQDPSSHLSILKGSGVKPLRKRVHISTVVSNSCPSQKRVEKSGMTCNAASNFYPNMNPMHV